LNGKIAYTPILGGLPQKGDPPKIEHQNKEQKSNITLAHSALKPIPLLPV
jgi:hypothetical protein